MNIISNFISEYGAAILYAVITALAGYTGVIAKKLCTKYFNDKTKQDVARTVVKAVEQLYKDLHGDEKLDKAIEGMSQMLDEKGIAISDLEMRLLIEAALSEFNNAFTNGYIDFTEEELETIGATAP